MGRHQNFATSGECVCKRHCELQILPSYAVAVLSAVHPHKLPQQFLVILKHRVLE